MTIFLGMFTVVIIIMVVVLVVKPYSIWENKMIKVNVEALTKGEATDIRVGFVAAYVVVGMTTVPCCVETPENYTCDYNKYNCIRYYPN